MRIHPTATIEEGAELGTGVDVGPGAHIAAGTCIGDGCRIGPHAVIYGSVTLGAECAVHAGAIIGDTPQDLAFTDVRSYVRIGARCTLREGVTIHRGTVEESATEMGEGCYLMAFSHLAHNVKLGKGVIMANGALLGGYVEMGDGVFVGGGAGIHQFCRVGRLAMIGGNCGCSQDVPPFCMTASVSLNELAGLNTVGLKRAGLVPGDRVALKKAYHTLFRGGRNLAAALAEVRTEPQPACVEELCSFIETSKRGVCTPPR